MGFTEALRLVVDADTRGAVQGIEKLGSAAEREFSKSEKSLDKWGNRLTSVGTGMIAFGGAALVGLGAMAQASEEARLSQLKLENTLANMPKLATATSKEFIDLAESIQKVTAADADAIVEGEALLGTFNLTADEIKGITPLVVDYARKFGIDIPDAAVQVGKALDGQVGALKRNGVSIDEVLFKTDRYRAVSEALSDQVGGFAEAEGATFAGSLQRMKNELGDLSEGVGKGAVDAFTTMFGAVEKAAGALESISPGAQSAIGQIATFGSVGLIAAGGISVLIGQVISARRNFAAAAEGISTLSTKLGGIRSIAAAGGAVTALAAVVLAVKAADDAAEQASFDDLRESLLSTSEAAAAASEQGVRYAFALGNLGSAFDAVLDSSVPAAEEFIRVAQAAGLSQTEIDKLRTALEEKKAADAGATEAQAEYNAEVDEAAGVTDAATEAVQSYSDTMRGLFDPIFAAVSAQQALSEANADVQAAELELIQAIHDHGENSLEAMAATDKLKDAQLQAAEAALGQESAMSDLQDAVANGTVSIADANLKLQQWVAQGLISQASAEETRRKFQEVADAANRIPRNIAVSLVVTSLGTAAVEEFHGVGRSRGPGHARGGPTDAGRIYEVVEEGAPELLTEGGRTYLLPGASGWVTPLSAMGGASSSGGQAIDVHSHVYLDGREITHTVKRVVRNDHGGDVQAALGWSAA